MLFNTTSFDIYYNKIYFNKILEMLENINKKLDENDKKLNFLLDKNDEFEKI